MTALPVPLYSVKGWDKTFESSQSRRYTTGLNWIRVPTDHSTLHFRRLMQRPDGASLYGSWVLILQVASKCDPRGVLKTTQGPLTAEDLALQTGASVDAMQDALQVLSSQDIGWLGREPPYEATHTASTPQAHATHTASTLDKIRVDKIRKETATTMSTPCGVDAAAAADKLEPVNTGTALERELVAAWRKETATALERELVAAWNSIPGIRHVLRGTLSPERRVSLRARLKDSFFRLNWKAALEEVKHDEWYTGVGHDRGSWRANITWFLRPGTVEKLLERRDSEQHVSDRRPDFSPACESDLGAEECPSIVEEDCEARSEETDVASDL